MKYTVVSTHAEVLANGQLAKVGETVEISNKDLDDEHNARLIRDGRLVEHEKIEPDPDPDPDDQTSTKEEDGQ